MKIVALSDTHGHLPKNIIKHLNDADEIWHAGDIGNVDIIKYLENTAVLRAVSGNIDSEEVCRWVPEKQNFECAGSKVNMLHIAGQPKKIKPEARSIIQKNKPNIFVCGHSHILRVEYLKKEELLWINPGACGKQGFHKVNTIVLFEINNGKAQNMNVVEWKR